MSELYQPEMGQVLFGAPTGEFDPGALGEACVHAALTRIETCYWNNHQKQWDRHTDPQIPGLDFRPYWWGDDDATERELPNLQLHGDPLEIRWYKYPMRGGSVNCDMSPAMWAAWLDKALQVVRQADSALTRFK